MKWKQTSTVRNKTQKETTTVFSKVPETMGYVSSHIDSFKESNIRKPLKATFTESNPERSVHGLIA